MNPVMTVHQEQQGSPEWKLARFGRNNASDAPAMLGCSKYQSREDLRRSVHTGLQAEVSADTQRLFDRGHQIEAIARPLAELITGEDLYTLVGSREWEGLQRPLGAAHRGVDQGVHVRPLASGPGPSGSRSR